MGVETEIGRLRRGDRDAFDALLARYQNRLYRYLLRLVRDPSQAEDLFQQTSLRVMTHLHRYDERRPFEPWLFAIARNLAIDHLRRTTPDNLDESSTDALAAKGPDAFETLLARERRSALAERVDKLAAIYKDSQFQAARRVRRGNFALLDGLYSPGRRWRGYQTRLKRLKPGESCLRLSNVVEEDERVARRADVAAEGRWVG